MKRESEQTALRLPADLMAAVRSVAKKKGLSQNAIMIMAIEKGLPVLRGDHLPLQNQQCTFQAHAQSDD